MFLYVAVALLVGLVGWFLFFRKQAAHAPARDPTMLGAAKKPAAASVPPKPAPKALVKIGSATVEEVKKHNKREDCWIIVDNKIYDVTNYIDSHPGGDAILRNAGADSTDGFNGEQHPMTVHTVIRDYYIGDLKK